MISMSPLTISRNTWDESAAGHPCILEVNHRRRPAQQNCRKKLLIAQAMAEDLQLLGRDGRLSAYEIKLIW